MTQVLLLGAGGHAQVVADALLRGMEGGSDLEPIGYLDDNPRSTGTRLLGLPVLGAIAGLGQFAHDATFVAVGDNATRARLFTQMLRSGEQLVNVIHPKAVVAPSSRLGIGVLLCAGSVVNPSSIIGDNVIVNTGATVDHHNDIGDHCHIAPGVHLGGTVQVGEGSLLGIGSTVLAGRRIGRWSVVGAGSVVVKDIPDNVTAIGGPARVTRTLKSGWQEA